MNVSTMKTFSLFALMVLSSFSYARNLENSSSNDDEYKCEFEGVNSLELPVFPQQVNSKKFNFKFQVVGTIDPDKTVIIYLPGGPGGSSMNDYAIPQVRKSRIANDLPGDVPWIMIDPRTVGCNRGDETVFPDESLTSENLAYDVLSLVKELKLKKYILYGHSYGSQSATFIAGLSKERGVIAPHALFLSGILGRGEADGSFSIPFNMALRWELIKATLSPEAREIIESSNPLEIEDRKWGKLIRQGLYDGFYMVNGVLKNPLMELLKGLEHPESEERKNLISSLNWQAGPSYGQFDFSERLFAKVDCHEFSPNDGGVKFVSGKLIPDYDPCQDEAFDRPYDSAQFEITSPIYYLAGTEDPAAPYEGARYHFEHQTLASRNFMTLQGGGHTKMGWIFQDCKDQMWRAIIETRNLDTVLKHCAVDVKLEMR